MSTPLARRFERYSTALVMISEGVAELEPAEAASLLRSALALVEAEPPAAAPRAAPRIDAPKAKQPGTTERAHELVTARGAATVGEVASALGVTVGSASASLRRLTADGRLKNPKRGTYEAKK